MFLYLQFFARIAKSRIAIQKIKETPNRAFRKLKLIVMDLSTRNNGVRNGLMWQALDHRTGSTAEEAVLKMEQLFYEKGLTGAKKSWSWVFV